MKENQIQQNTIEYLSIMANIHNFIFFAPMNEGFMMIMTMFKVPKSSRYKIINFLKKMGMLPGVADLQIIKDGKSYFIELKTDTGELSNSQVLFQDACNRTHTPYVVCRSVDDVRMVLVKWGVVR